MLAAALRRMKYPTAIMIANAMGANVVAVDLAKVAAVFKQILAEFKAPGK